jgi:hypothetical protein
MTGALRNPPTALIFALLILSSVVPVCGQALFPRTSAGTSLAAQTTVAWRYFGFGNGIHAASKLPRGWVGGNLFTFWDFGMSIDGTIGGYMNGLIGQTEYRMRIDALLTFLETMQLDSIGKPHYTYYWDSGAPASSEGMNGADSGRTLNALGFLRRTDASYASRIDNFLRGRGKPWVDALSGWGLTLGVYGRDVALALAYFSYLSDNYNKTAWLNDFYDAWGGSNRVIDAYGNSMPQMAEVNFGPIAYELLERGPDYARTLQYASDMKTWIQTRYQVTSKYGTWGSEFHVTLSDGSAPFAWEFFVARVLDVGYKTWQIKLANGQWLDENDPALASAVDSLDAAYAAKAIFPSDAWVDSIFTRFAQNDLETTCGFFEGVLEVTNEPDASVSVSHNAVILLAAMHA